jgi:uncharacterized protein YgbK (DUF1537 family)
MLEITVIADDLTGAADTGVQFCPYFSETILTSYRNLLQESFSGAFQALSIYTNSRSMLLPLYPKHIYKKVDSCLRGNIGAEVDAIMDEMGFDLSFIAPAFPDMGRTTVHDIHLLDGTPVARTEISRDPVTPVNESRLSRVVAAQCGYKVGHVDMEFLGCADDVVSEEITGLVESGARHLAFDTTANAHLDTIVRLALASPKKILLVGSAGLAEALGRQFPKGPLRDKHEKAAFPAGNHLLVCGTVSERTKMQLSTLLETYPYEMISLDPRLLADLKRRDELLSKAHFTQSLLSRNDLIIRIDPPEKRGTEAVENQWPLVSEQIVDGLGFFVGAIIEETKPASLFLSGGDTANAVLKAINAEGIKLSGEIVPGMGRGTLIGGLIDGLPVVTKAGAFGKDDTLIALHEHWARTGASRHGEAPPGRFLKKGDPK